MRLFTDVLLASRFPNPAQCVDWVRESFLAKSQTTLPAKTSLHPQNTDFFNTMPCLLAPERKRFGVKIVHRIAGATPTLGGVILLFNSSTGELLAQMDSDRITTMRTGAVAALSAQTFRRSGSVDYGFIGLGNTARATLLCLLETEPDTLHYVNVLRYKDQADNFFQRFAAYPNVVFREETSTKDIVRNSDVIFSCLTEATTLLCSDDTAYREGCTLIPVHTKGFQNCDLFFDRVYADDYAHVSGFRYFNRFRHFAETGDVLRGKDPGRIDDEERILCYNIGLAIHDIHFADRLYDALASEAPEILSDTPKSKFYI